MLHKNAERTQNNILINKASNARKSKDTEFFIFCSHISIATSSTKKKKKKEESNKNLIHVSPEFIPIPVGKQC